MPISTHPYQKINPFFTSTVGYFRRICEGKSLSINCGCQREIDVKFAFYGRRQRGVCSVLGLDSNTNCGASNSVTIAKNTCQGQQSCVLHATNSEFGDSCVGTEKHLDVSSTTSFLVHFPDSRPITATNFPTVVNLTQLAASVLVDL